jgi:hypothetical protein
MSKSQYPILNVIGMLVGFIRYFDVERIMGLGMLAYAFATAFDPLSTNTTTRWIIQSVNVNPVILSHWYLFSGLYLISKGDKINSVSFLICMFPISIEIVSDMLFAASASISVNYLGSSIIIALIVIRRIVYRFLHEVFEKSGLEEG